jgi:beta-amylase
MSLPHQIGAISGTQLTMESTVGASSEAHSSTTVGAFWRSPGQRNNLRVSVQPESDRVSVSPSPPLSPRVGGVMNVAAQALMTPRTEEDVIDWEHVAGGVQGKEEKGKGVPVYVMMPLDSVTWNHSVNRKKAMNASLQALKSAGVEGIMMDVWWGLVETERPGEYNWGG